MHSVIRANNSYQLLGPPTGGLEYTSRPRSYATVAAGRKPENQRFHAGCLAARAAASEARSAAARWALTSLLASSLTVWRTRAAARMSAFLCWAVRAFLTPAWTS